MMEGKRSVQVRNDNVYRGLIVLRSYRPGVCVNRSLRKKM